MRIVRLEREERGGHAVAGVLLDLARNFGLEVIGDVVGDLVGVESGMEDEDEADEAEEAMAADVLGCGWRGWRCVRAAV